MNGNQSSKITNACSNQTENRTEGILTLKRKVLSNIEPSKVLAEETIEIQKILIQPTSCTNPEYAKDLSFSSRYAYDGFNFLQFLKKPTKQPPPMNKNPQFTPWRERFNHGIPDPEPRKEERKTMEDTEPHYLLQDQAGYLGNEPAPYPRQAHFDYNLF